MDNLPFFLLINPKQDTERTTWTNKLPAVQSLLKGKDIDSNSLKILQKTTDATFLQMLIENSFHTRQRIPHNNSNKHSHRSKPNAEVE